MKLANVFLCIQFSFRIISLNRVHKTVLDGGSSSNFFSHSLSLPLSALLKQITAPDGDGEFGNKLWVKNYLIIHVKTP